MTVTVQTSQKVDTNAIIDMFDKAGLKTHDFVEYSGNKLTITRNPFGFVNTKKRGALKGTQKRVVADKTKTRKIKGGAQGVIVNNYIYNAKNFGIQYKLSPTEWAGHTLVTGMMSIVGNVMEKGLDSRSDLPFSYYAGGPVKVYWDDNTVVGAAVQSNRILLGDPTRVNQPPARRLYSELL